MNWGFTDFDDWVQWGYNAGGYENIELNDYEVHGYSVILAYIMEILEIIVKP